MAVSEYHFDTRIRRRHVPLITQQRRLRHLRSLSVRNITLPRNDASNEFGISFSLHKKVDTPAFYTSEVLGDDLNPSWKDFECSNFPGNVDTASTYVIVKVWNMIGGKHLLIEWLVFFSGLVYLGEQIPKEGKNFKPNTIIFGMSEGYYGCNDSYQHTACNAGDALAKDSIEAEVSGLRTSYNLSTLSRIKTVERAIKQTQAAVQRRRDKISQKLQESRDLHMMYAKKELLKIRLSILRKELQTQQQGTQSLENEIALLRDETVHKRNQINEKSEDQKKLMEKYVELFKYHNECRETLLKTEAQLNFRRKQLVTELGCIYPIDEFPDQKGFSIHNVHLPNSENFSGHDDVMISVALGYVCHIVLMISQFLNVPLRYVINFYGSRSSIMDHITSSLPEKTREFALYIKNRDRRSFEYGVFLLNKNIAQLRIFCRMSTTDLSATLPNLSSLIELRLSTNSEASLPKDRKVPISIAGYTQNYSNQSPIKQSESELDLLKREMAAMIPKSINHLQLPAKPLDNILSSSLDKGLNDMRLLENTNATPPEVNNQVNLLKQTTHHSSFPNLNTTLNIAGGFDVDVGLNVSPTPPLVWTAESSRTNSEDDQIEDEVVKVPKRPVVLNDSIFYIPSIGMNGGKENGYNGGINKSEVVQGSEDFSADLSMRTDRLAKRKFSFQMQKLRSSSAEEEQ